MKIATSNRGRRYPSYCLLFLTIFLPRLRYSRGYMDVSDLVEEVDRVEEEWVDQSEKERERYEKRLAIITL